MAFYSVANRKNFFFSTGVPHHTEERSHHHSPRAKLQRMLQKNKSILDAVVQASQEKQETGATELETLNKQAQIAAL